MSLTFRFSAALTWLAFAFAAPLAVADDQPVDYVRDVKPILQANCYKCHGPDEQESDLRLDTGRLAIDGGVSGRAIVPGDSGKSLLYLAISGESDDVIRMPPEDEAEALTATQVALIRRWIDSGAKLPADEQPAPSRAEKRKHWSFQPIAPPAVPEVQEIGWANNAIDRFIQSKLEEHGLQPSAEADRVTLIRRLSLDLIGIPPTIEDVDAFVADERPDAYERLVDRLLGSPRYGERWARHWLDQARYADSDGYTNDVAREMWLYRDWVIDALNRDLPFDQFTIEQIAGDLLEKPTTEQQIATGFHRNTQHNREGGSDAEQYRVERVVDRVSTTGVVWLGLTLGCARCHDHKFDPISQREFYEMLAFFNSQDEPQITVGLVSQANPGEKPPTTTTLVVRERPQPRETYVHIRGDFLRKGKRVTPNTPAALTSRANDDDSPSRLEFARWLVAADNPLTPRVTANRHWQYFFGKGIVETENDFGTQGTPPSHPELLDWLAAEFVQSGWSAKQLHRLIVTSATYRQSSAMRSDLEEVDPNNTLLARQNRMRLEAESIRDSALAAAGLLSGKMKGPSVFPPQPDGVMKMTRNPNRKWETSRGDDRYRRGLYTYFWRSTPHPFLKLFNAPDSNVTCTRRDRSNTPLQSLTLLNDETFVEAAQSLAVRTLRELPAADDAERLNAIFQYCLSRRPTVAEAAALAELLAAELSDATGVKEQARFQAAASLPSQVDAQTLAAWTTVARALLNLDEFITRE